MEEAVSALRLASVRPTDIGAWNTIWDGLRVTIVDFVDEDLEDNEG